MAGRPLAPATKPEEGCRGNAGVGTNGVKGAKSLKGLKSLNFWRDKQGRFFPAEDGGARAHPSGGGRTLTAQFTLGNHPLGGWPQD